MFCQPPSNTRVCIYSHTCSTFAFTHSHSFVRFVISMNFFLDSLYHSIHTVVWATLRGKTAMWANWSKNGRRGFVRKHVNVVMGIRANVMLVFERSVFFLLYLNLSRLGGGGGGCLVRLPQPAIASVHVHIKAGWWTTFGTRECGMLCMVWNLVYGDQRGLYKKGVNSMRKFQIDLVEG